MSKNVLAANKRYTGKFVAFRSFNDHKVVAYGSTAVKAVGNANKKGVENPVIVYAPKKEETFLL